jgi:hypothetical protein
MQMTADELRLQLTLHPDPIIYLCDLVAAHITNQSYVAGDLAVSRSVAIANVLICREYSPSLYRRYNKLISVNLYEKHNVEREWITVDGVDLCEKHQVDYAITAVGISLTNRLLYPYLSEALDVMLTYLGMDDDTT